MRRFPPAKNLPGACQTPPGTCQPAAIRRPGIANGLPEPAIRLPGACRLPARTCPRPAHRINGH